MELQEMIKGLQLIKSVTVDLEQGKELGLCDKEAGYLSLQAIDEAIELLQIQLDNQEEIR